MCAMNGATHRCSRAARITATETEQPHEESNNLANIILDLRYVTGYGSG